MISASKRSPPIAHAARSATTSGSTIRGAAAGRAPARMSVRSEVPAPKSATSTSSSRGELRLVGERRGDGLDEERDLLRSPPARPRGAAAARRSASASGSRGRRRAGRPRITASRRRRAGLRRPRGCGAAGSRPAPRACAALLRSAWRGSSRLGSQDFTDWMKRPSTAARYSSMASRAGEDLSVLLGKEEHRAEERGAGGAMRSTSPEGSATALLLVPKSRPTMRDGLREFSSLRPASTRGSPLRW